MTEVPGGDLQTLNSTEPDCPALHDSSQPHSVDPPVSVISGGWRNGLRVLLDHRRQTAVAIILVCMAVVYTEDSDSTDSAADTESATEMTSVESLLQDFDTVDSQTLREPAEPVSQSVSEFRMTVPLSPGNFSADSGGPAQSPSSTAAAVYPDHAPAAEFSTGSTFTIPNTTQQTSPASMQDSGRRKGVRFTGQIQPLK